MKPEHALAEVELRRGGKRLRVEALVDTGASRRDFFRRFGL